MPNEAVTIVQDMTMHLLALGVGVFALVGGYLSSTNHRELRGKRTLLFSLLLFGASVVGGLIVLMRLADMAVFATPQKPINLLDKVLTLASCVQLGCAIVAAVVFFFYLFKNLWGKT